MAVFSTPRFSYSVSKLAVYAPRAVPVLGTSVVHVGYGLGTGYGTGWVYRVGNTGSHPPKSPPRGYQRSGPRRPCRGRSGWVSSCGVGGPCTTLRARSVTLQVPSLYRTLAYAASWPIRARLRVNSSKVSQNG